MNFVIAIDGPSASGKGTLSRALARVLGAAHMDTGALYRAVGHIVLKNGGHPEDARCAVAAVETLMLALQAGEDVLGHDALRSDEIGQAASQVAAIPQVRSALINMQKDFARNPAKGFSGAVLDGRDIGTVICPDADVKLFVTAGAEIRAQRRQKELQSKGIQATYEAVLQDMHARDARDAGRKDAPMAVAADAVVLDTGTLTPQEALEKALEIIREKLAARS